MRLSDDNVSDQVAQHVAQCDNTEQATLLSASPFLFLWAT